MIATPQVSKAVIEIPGGKKFILEAKNLGRGNIYVQKIVLNGQLYSKTFIRHSDIVKGGNMVLYMGNKPSSEWGTKEIDLPGRN